MDHWKRYERIRFNSAVFLSRIGRSTDIDALYSLYRHRLVRGRRPTAAGLQVARCCTGTAAPTLVANPAGGYWRRSDLARWLVEQTGGRERLLLGIDFSFAYPYCDEQAYFPGHAATPGDVYALWERMGEICAAQDREFYGGSSFCSAQPRSPNTFATSDTPGSVFTIAVYAVASAESAAAGAVPELYLQMCRAGFRGDRYACRHAPAALFAQQLSRPLRRVAIRRYYTCRCRGRRGLPAAVFPPGNTRPTAMAESRCTEWHAGVLPHRGASGDEGNCNRG